MEINLTNSDLKTVIDDSDKALVKNACFLYRGYAFTSVKGKPVGLHRLIMRTPKGMVTDHINCDKLDNRRSNLRVCTNRQNILGQKVSKDNTSGYKGVSWSRGMKKWRAAISVNYKKIILGHFSEITDAAEAYLRAAKLHYGAYAK